MIYQSAIFWYDWSEVSLVVGSDMQIRKKIAVASGNIPVNGPHDVFS